MDDIRIHLIIEGRVQGVWFRDSTRREAVSLGVLGWVRNRSDGTVEVLAEGPEDKVRELITWCHHGPPAAGVSRVQESQEKWQGEFNSFDIVF
jgi:acylphosphatase